LRVSATTGENAVKFDRVAQTITSLCLDRRVRATILGSAGLLIGAAAGVASYAFLHEPRQVTLRRLTIHLPRAAGRIPPAGLRVLHLSDTHFQGRDWRERAKIDRIRRLVAGLEVDLLVHTGDFVHTDGGLDNVAALLDALPTPRLGRYAVLGNHDYTRYNTFAAAARMWQGFCRQESLQGAGRRPLPPTPAQLLRFGRYVRATPLDGKRTGVNNVARLTELLAGRDVHILHNQAVHLGCRVGVAGFDLYLAGVDDVGEGRPRLHHALDGVPPGAPVILLSHNPDILESPRISRADLVLAGHTHGGQIVLPLWGPAHTQSLILERTHVAGCFRWGACQVYITRGIGEGIPVRLGAKPEFALITVLPG
jgi:hypothetical protein